MDVYLQNGGYQALDKALKQMTPDSIIEEVKKSSLRGRGGAGFPTGMKWSFVPKDSPKAKYVICNADESEPGTCKDRPLMEMDPHQLIEGIIIAGPRRSMRTTVLFTFAGNTATCWTSWMPRLKKPMRVGIWAKIFFGSGFDFDLLIHTGAGAYECGEESALMESLEGKRGYPRIKPPFPAIVGLYGCPTIINNVETLSAVPSIILEGGEAYANRGTPKNGGTRLLCISGHVNKPGIYEIPLGMNMKKFIDEVAGGIRGGKKLEGGDPGRQFLPGVQSR